MVRLSLRRGGRKASPGEQRAFSLKKEAEAWLRAELQLAREGRPTIPHRQTVGELLDEWLAVVSHRLAPSTLGEYRRIVDHRLRSHLGSVKLADLRPAHIAGMFELLREPGGNRRGNTAGGLSETSLMHTHAVLRTAPALAVKQRFISSNPAEDVDRPKRRQGEMVIWSADEPGRFMAFCRRDRLYPLLRLAAFSGMRRSELLGLMWSDVDLDRGTVSVRRARTRLGYEMVDRAETKSAAGSSRSPDGVGRGPGRGTGPVGRGLR
jgi:integrase